MMIKAERKLLLEKVAEIAAAYVASNQIAPSELADLVASIHQSLVSLSQRQQDHVPAVPVNTSIKRSHLVCMECGAKLTMLKQHLMVRHELTPQQYRLRYGLKADYPMVCKSYTARRSLKARKNSSDGIS